MKIKNVMLVSSFGIALIAGNVHCAKIQENIALNKQSFNTLYKEKINNISNLLLQELKPKPREKNIVSPRLKKIKNKYPEAAEDIDIIKNAIEQITECLNQNKRPKDMARDLKSPLKKLIRTLTNLKNQDTNAFYTVIANIDILHIPDQGYLSISEILDMANSNLSFKIQDKDSLVSKYLTSNSIENVNAMLDYLQSKYSTNSETVRHIGSLKEYLAEAIYWESNPLEDPKYWVRTLLYRLDSVGIVLHAIKISDPQLYDKIVETINRLYLIYPGKHVRTDKYTKNMQNLVIIAERENETHVSDYDRILITMTAYAY